MRQQRFPADMSTRRMRENIDPATGDPREGAAPYRAIGTDAQANTNYRAIGSAGGSVSLKDTRSGGLFAKGSIKENWRADGGLNTPLGRSAQEISKQTEGSVSQKANAASAASGGKLGVIQNQLDDYLVGESPSMVMKGSVEDESYINQDTWGTQEAADGGQVRTVAGKLDDYVFNGSMSDKDRMQVMRVMNRKYGARGVLS